MPFPVAHALLGASVVIAGSPEPIQANGAGLRKLALGSFLGILPDLDYVGIWFFGFDRSWHRGPSHSLLVAVAVGALLSPFFREGSRLRWSIIYASAMASHGILDTLLSIDRGAALLWPFTANRIGAGFWEYADIFSLRYEVSADVMVIRGIRQVLKYSAVEFVAMGLVLIATLMIKRRCLRSTEPP